jgi:DNA polymerase V
MAAIARRMVAAVFRPHHVYTKTGVILDELSPVGSGQASLFTAAEDPWARALVAAMDSLNARFGRGTTTIAAAGMGAKASDTRRERLSPHWTTRISDVPVAK